MVHVTVANIYLKFPETISMFKHMFCMLLCSCKKYSDTCGKAISQAIPCKLAYKVLKAIILQKGEFILESILCVDIPVQMIFCTDTDGKITPIRFRFRDKTGELVSIVIDKVLSEDQDRNKVGAHFSCAARVHGAQKIFRLRYSYFSHEWRLSGLYI